MPDWITKASKSLTRGTPKSPEPFEIPCSCGQSVRGMRQPHFQRVVCAECGEPSFVLPLDAYPPSRPKKRRKRKRKKGQALARASSAVQIVGPAVRQHLGRQARKMGQKAAATSRRAAGWSRSIFTPFRLVLLCMLLAIASTGYWVLRSEAREQAELQLKEGQQKGFAALSAQRFSQAEQELRAACDALDVLGRDDRLSREVRQMWREATALANLAQASPFEIVEQAEQHIHAGPGSWDDHFQSYYAGGWLVLETTLSRAGDAEAEYVFDLPLLFEGQRIDLRGDLQAFDHLSVTAEPRQVIFAAQLESCRLQSSESPRWVITLRPESGFLWVNFENYRAIGFEQDEFRTEEHVRRVLDEQARSLGIRE